MYVQSSFGVFLADCRRETLCATTSNGVLRDIQHQMIIIHSIWRMVCSKTVWTQILFIDSINKCQVWKRFSLDVNIFYHCFVSVFHGHQWVTIPTRHVIKSDSMNQQIEQFYSPILWRGLWNVQCPILQIYPILVSLKMEVSKDVPWRYRIDHNTWSSSMFK